VDLDALQICMIFSTLISLNLNEKRSCKDEDADEFKMSFYFFHLVLYLFLIKRSVFSFSKINLRTCSESSNAHIWNYFLPRFSSCFLDEKNSNLKWFQDFEQVLRWLKIHCLPIRKLA